MRVHRLVALFVVLFAPMQPALAQEYATPRPIPATTSAPILHAQAVAREIHERFRIGLQALDAGHNQSALAEFQRIVALDPPEPKGSTALYDLALAQARLNRNDDAAQSLRRAISRDPGFLAAMANLVAIDLRRNDLAEARAVADRFVSLAPESARALYSRGLVALQTHDLATARADFSKLLGNDPRYALAHYDLGVAEAHAGDYASAEREFAAAVEMAPSYALARFALGTVLLHEGNRVAARDAFARAAHDASGDPQLQTLATAMRDAITH